MSAASAWRPARIALPWRRLQRLIVKAGVTVDIVDVGGGFPAPYPGMTPPPLADYVAAIEEAFEDMMVLENADLWCEPGRALIAEASRC
jgi:ornithine decarboxylase